MSLGEILLCSSCTLRLNPLKIKRGKRQEEEKHEKIEGERRKEGEREGEEGEMVVKLHVRCTYHIHSH